TRSGRCTAREVPAAASLRCTNLVARTPPASKGGRGTPGFETYHPPGQPWERGMGNPFDLSGHVALVTGGNSGIGLGMAEGLAAAGASVCIWGRSEGRNEAAREKIATHGGKVVAIGCDVSSAEQVEAGFAETLGQLGRIDSCFACAGVAAGFQRFLEMTPE